MARRNNDGFRLSNILGDSFWTITSLMGLIGWSVALVGSILDARSDSEGFPVLSWWGICFQFMTDVLLYYAILWNRIPMYNGALLSLLAVSTVYSTNSTNNFVWRSSTTAAAVAAGQILLSVVNILWIIYIGTTPDEPTHKFLSSFSSNRVPTIYTYGRPKNDSYRQRSVVQSQNPFEMTHQANQAGNQYPQLYTSDQLRGFEEIDTSHNTHSLSGRPMSAHSGGMSARQNGSTYSTYTDQSEAYSQPVEYNYRARALFAYDANPDDTNELSFQQGEILDLSDVTGRWWQARRENGEVGIVPSNYVVLLSP